MMQKCKPVPKLQQLAHRIGTRSKAGAESALFCSNYLAWQDALANHKDKDFIIIMEDDARLLGDKAQMWKKVDGLLSSECQDWDHMNVDPYEGAFQPALRNAGKCG